jgi:hypothetical protein
VRRRICFENEHDEGAPEIPLILAISYTTRAAVDTALASPQRAVAKAATEAVLERYFTGRIHHHITQAVESVDVVAKGLSALDKLDAAFK